ncbi:MAG: signal peptidase I [Tenericutes bacterium]|jgi:signal peptidase I|nr:signal peptidase I [Mycoplasmatota bacterium]
MTLKKAYKTLIITIILMMLTIIFYALDVSKLALQWGMVGFVISAVLSIFSIVLSIHSTKHEREILKVNFFNRRRFEILDWFTFLSVSLMAIFIIFMFIVLPSDVKHSSMMPTLQEGERILIYHFNYEPEVEDIIILKMTKENYDLVPNSMYIERDRHGNIIRIHDVIYFVKRLKAAPGDLIEFVNYNILKEQYEISINGEVILTPQNEPYYVLQNQREIIELSLEQGILKDGLYLAFGDNANGYLSYPASFDSRSFGAVLEEDIVGKAIYKLWPVGRVE